MCSKTYLLLLSKYEEMTYLLPLKNDGNDYQFRRFLQKGGQRTEVIVRSVKRPRIKLKCVGQ